MTFPEAWGAFRQIQPAEQDRQLRRLRQAARRLRPAISSSPQAPQLPAPSEGGPAQLRSPPEHVSCITASPDPTSPASGPVDHLPVPQHLEVRLADGDLQSGMALLSVHETRLLVSRIRGKT